MIAAVEVMRLIDEDPGIILLDIRDPRDYVRGHIRTAASLPADIIQQATTKDELDAMGLLDIVQAKGLSSTDDASGYIVYCYKGVLSARSTKKLLSLGYSEVYDAGGVSDWPFGLVK